MKDKNAYILLNSTSLSPWKPFCLFKIRTVSDYYMNTFISDDKKISAIYTEYALSVSIKTPVKLCDGKNKKIDCSYSFRFL